MAKLPDINGKDRKVPETVRWAEYRRRVTEMGFDPDNMDFKAIAIELVEVHGNKLGWFMVGLIDFIKSDGYHKGKTTNSSNYPAAGREAHLLEALSGYIHTNFYKLAELHKSKGRSKEERA